MTNRHTGHCQTFFSLSFSNADNCVDVETNNVIKEAAVSAVTTPFAQSEGKRMNKERTEQCHKAVTRFLVKTLQPLSVVESPWFRWAAAGAMRPTRGWDHSRQPVNSFDLRLLSESW